MTMSFIKRCKNIKGLEGTAGPGIDLKFPFNYLQNILCTNCVINTSKKNVFMTFK